MMYLVFSLDENGCQDFWECFEDRNSAELYLIDAYNDVWMDYEKNFEEMGSEFSGRCPDENLDYAILRWKDEENENMEHMTEFFLVEIPDSEVIRRLCRV